MAATVFSFLTAASSCPLGWYSDLSVTREKRSLPPTTWVSPKTWKSPASISLGCCCR